MTAEPIQKFDDHLARAASWADDRNEMLRSSRRTAWRIAIATTVIAVCEGLALMALTPLKTVVPYTLLVDRQTGYVEALRPLEPKSITADAALTRSFLVQYVIAHEGFAIEGLQSDYRKVALWSAGDARTQYLSSMQTTSPDNPLVRYPRSTVVDVFVKSVTSISPSTAQIRFDTRRTDAGGQASPPAAWVALVHFSYSGEPMSVADRMINPLGFKIDRYRKSAEAIAPDGYQEGPNRATMAPPFASAPIIVSPNGQAVAVRRLRSTREESLQQATETMRR